MIELYPGLKHLHMFAALMSGGLFFVRGLVLNLGGKWPLATPIRRLSMTIDTILLLSAALLAVTLQQYPFVHAWLTMKVILLVVYVVLGIYALRSGRTRLTRLAFWIAALVVYAFIISVARSHHWLGAFA